MPVIRHSCLFSLRIIFPFLVTCTKAKGNQKMNCARRLGIKNFWNFLPQVSVEDDSMRRFKKREDKYMANKFINRYMAALQPQIFIIQ